ncbi:MAG TPA: diguanylate cyclase [Nitrospira sp.]
MLGLEKFLHEFFQHRAESKTAQLGQVIKSALRQTMLRNPSDGLVDTLDHLEKDSDIRRVWIIDKNGRVAHAADNSAMGRVLDKAHDPICTVCHSNGNVPQSQTLFTRDEGGTPILRHVNPIANDKDCWGCHDSKVRLNGILLLEESTRAFETALGTIQYRLGATGGITLVILVALTLLVITLFVERPVRRLMAGVRQFGAGNLAVRIPVRGRSELEDLARSFNLMAEGFGSSLEEVQNKNSELSMVYSIVERLTKTINLGELKEIILQTLMDVFVADQVLLLSYLTQQESGETLIKSRGEKRLARSYHRGEAGEVLPDNFPSDITSRWLRGELQDSVVTPDGHVAALPVRSADRNLALLLVKRERPFERQEVNPKLLRALADHVSVAFENARLFTLAITDELTQLFTVRHLRNRVDDAVSKYKQSEQSFSLLMLDLDYFKSINDRFGHPAGDEVLRQVAQVLTRCVRTVDSAYRYGGEEFAVLLPDTDSAPARVVAERIRREVEGLKITVDGGENIGVTVSIGLANCPANGASYQDLVTAADTALYEAKHAGRNRVSEPPARA